MLPRLFLLAASYTLTVLASGPAPAAGGDKPAPKAALADAVAEWAPAVKGAKVVKRGGALGGDAGPRVAAHTFEVTGASFGEVWDLYAAKCGLEDRFDEKVFRGLRWEGGKGKPSYAVSETETRPGERVSVFTSRSGGVTASAAIQPKGDGKTVLCVLTVVLDG